VFDWSWANAYQEHGLAYYPKLVCAIPFTPSTGPRIGFSSKHSSEQKKLQIISALNQAIQVELDTLQGSSAHLLFPDKSLSSFFSSEQWVQRTGIQYHWHNHAYQNFDDFVSRFKSRKRKMILKERAFVKQQGITFSIIEGKQISGDLISKFYTYYQRTYLKKNASQGYLNLEFFLSIQRAVPDCLMMTIAKKEQDIIGIALYFKDSETLYGRYWGCEQEHEFLHFEACYYQGIEYCIRHKLKTFDAGAQGEHKLTRGFYPIKTYSNHLILNADFRKAIEEYTSAESAQLDDYVTQAKSKLPYKLELNC
jgi:hypothetical protein